MLPTMRSEALALAAVVCLLVACNTSSAVSSGKPTPTPGPYLSPVSAGVTGVRITRTPGLLILPVVDVTITDSPTARRLASDILALKKFPSGIFNCPLGFGTSYLLVFAVGGTGTWWAELTVLGCQEVNLSDGEKRWGFDATSLLGDLGAALGMTPDQVQPRPCDVSTTTVCYAQPSPPSSS